MCLYIVLTEEKVLDEKIHKIVLSISDSIVVAVELVIKDFAVTIS